MEFFKTVSDSGACSLPAECCYLLFITILSALKALGFYEGQTVFTIFLVIACVFLVGKLLLTQHSGVEWAAIVLFLGMGAFVYLNTGEKSLLINLMVLVGIKGVPGKKVMKTFLSVWGSCYVLLTFFSLTGICSDKLFMHDKHGIGFVLCHSLGYSHSNVLHINYLCISAMVLYLAKERFDRRGKLALLTILTAIDLYVFLYSMSFTGLLGTLALYGIYLYTLLRGSLGRIERFLAQLVLPLCLLFSLIGPLVLKDRLFELIDNALNTRYNLTRWFLTNQPITLFGTRFVDLPSADYTLDCSYSYLFMQLGVVPFAVLMLLYAGTIHRLVRENRLAELSIVLGLCIAGIAEPFLFNLGFKNVSLLFVGEYLYDLLRKIQVQLKSTAQLRILSWENAPGGRLIRFSEQFGSSICHEGCRILCVWMQHAKGFLLLAAATAAVICAGTWLLLPRPEVVYIGEGISADDPLERTAEYLEAGEVEDLLAGGSLIFDYEGEEAPMYAYYGSAPAAEYARRIVSGGFWCAAAVCCILAAAIDRRPPRRGPLLRQSRNSFAASCSSQGFGT